jgi:hypothetical protein
MKTIILLALAIACQSAPPAFRVTTQTADLAGCEGIPTFAPLACPKAKDCQECSDVLSLDAKKLGANALLMEHKGSTCQPTEVIGIPFKCPNP